jgi:hypothetical protein
VIEIGLSKTFRGFLPCSSTSPTTPNAAGAEVASMDPYSVKPFGFPDDHLGSVTINTGNLHSLEGGEQVMDDIVDFYFK